MPRPLHEQVVVITGASSGIGRETALQFAQKGANLVLAARNTIALSQVADEIRSHDAQVHIVPTDVTDFKAVEHLAAEAISVFGKVDTWINNASVAMYATVDKSTVEEIERVIQVNLLGVIHGCKAILPHMRQQGYGTIINVGSVTSWVALPLLSAYSAAKQGVKGFTDALRLEMEREQTGIQVTLIMPSGINTPFFNHARSKLGVMPQPMPPVYRPEMVAKLMLYAAEHPQRDIYAGGAGLLFAMIERLSPGLIDRFLMIGNFGFRSQKSNQPDNREDNLFSPMVGPGRVQGDYASMTKPSFFASLVEMPKQLLIFPGIVASALVLISLRRKSS